MSTTTSTEAKDLPTLHHLNNSQSQRILWLLEELSIPYILVLHTRDAKTMRAPPELKTVQSLGKSPVLVTPDGIPITESSAIAAYLLREYDPKGLFRAKDVILDESLTSFSGSSLGTAATIYLIFDVAARRTPWPLCYLTRAMRGGMYRSFVEKEFKISLEYLQDVLGDQDWFNGETLGRADFILSFPLDIMAQRGWFDFDKDYPKLRAWRTRVQNREAWKAALEKGNGYDLNTW